MKAPHISFSVRSDAAYFLKATLVGILVGGLATGFHTGLDFLFSRYAALRLALGPGYMPYVVSMAISAACVTGAFLLIRRVAPEAAGSSSSIGRIERTKALGTHPRTPLASSI